MYPRTEFEMTKEDLEKILDACKPTPVMKIGNYVPAGPQENANRAWQLLGKKMGFDYMTVRPIPGKGERFFTAIPSENEAQRTERLKREAEEKRMAEINAIEKSIEEQKNKLARLKSYDLQGA